LASEWGAHRIAGWLPCGTYIMEARFFLSHQILLHSSEIVEREMMMRTKYHAWKAKNPHILMSCDGCDRSAGWRCHARGLWCIPAVAPVLRLCADHQIEFCLGDQHRH